MILSVIAAAAGRRSTEEGKESQDASFGLLLVVMPTNWDYLLNSHPHDVCAFLQPESLPFSPSLTAPTAQPSGRQPQVQMHRVWQGLQIQAPSEGTPPDS